MSYTAEQQKQIMAVVEDIFKPSNSTAAYVSDSYIAVQNISYAQAKLKTAIEAGTVTDAKSVVQYLYDSINNFDAENKEEPTHEGKIGIQPRLSRTFSRNTDNVVERFMLQSGGDPNQLYVELQSRLYPLLTEIDSASSEISGTTPEVIEEEEGT